MGDRRPRPAHQKRWAGGHFSDTVRLGTDSVKMADCIDTGFPQFPCALVQMRYSIGENGWRSHSHGGGGITLVVRKEGGSGGKKGNDGEWGSTRREDWWTEDKKWNNQKPEVRTSKRRSRKNDQGGGKVWNIWCMGMEKWWKRNFGNIKLVNGNKRGAL